MSFSKNFPSAALADDCLYSLLCYKETFNIPQNYWCNTPKLHHLIHEVFDLVFLIFVLNVFLFL